MVIEKVVKYIFRNKYEMFKELSTIEDGIEQKPYNPHLNVEKAFDKDMRKQDTTVENLNVEYGENTLMKNILPVQERVRRKYAFVENLNVEYGDVVGQTEEAGCAIETMNRNDRSKQFHESLHINEVFNQEISKDESLTECPICRETLSPLYVYQCFEGHIYCGLCKTKLKKCPQCNVPLSEKGIRNRYLESLLQLVMKK